MTISLVKGGNVSLNKDNASLTAIAVGLGWEARTTDGAAFDLDASVFLLNAQGQITNDGNFVFFNNLKSPDGSVVHQGDNRTGDAEDDDETINVDLKAVPSDVSKLVFVVSIYEAADRKQNFGQVRHAYIRIVNQEGNVELAGFDLSEDASTSSIMIFGEVYRSPSNASEWKFKAIAESYSNGLPALLQSYQPQANPSM